MFDKLKFWKKDDPFDSYPLPEDQHNDPFSSEHTNQTDPFQSQTPTDFGKQQPISPQQIAQAPQSNHYEQQNSTMSSRDVELILSKLDGIKVSVENLSHRIDALERNQQPPKNTW